MMRSICLFLLLVDSQDNNHDDGRDIFGCCFAVVLPKCCTSLQEAWERCTPATEGIIDQLVSKT